MPLSFIVNAAGIRAFDLANPLYPQPRLLGQI